MTDLGILLRRARDVQTRWMLSGPHAPETPNMRECVEILTGICAQFEEPIKVLEHLVDIGVQDEHYVTLSMRDWSMQHSLGCRLEGDMLTCPFHAAMVDLGVYLRRDEYLKGRPEARFELRHDGQTYFLSEVPD